jgi:hypothetical protein
MIALSEVATRDSKLLGLGTVFYSPGKKNLARKSSEVSCSRLITENKAYLAESDVTVCDTIKYSRSHALGSCYLSHCADRLPSLPHSHR